MKLLLIEDDLQLGAAEMRALEMAGFEVCWIRLLRDADTMLLSQAFDAVLLDLTLPDGNGLELLIRWRRRGERVPVIILTARDAVEERIGGLDSGADDYLPKPFSIPELISRLRALTRRAAALPVRSGWWMRWPWIRSIGVSRWPRIRSRCHRRSLMSCRS